MIGDADDPSEATRTAGGARPPDGLAPLRDVIREFDLAADKALGQNFLLDFNLTRRIARLAAGGNTARPGGALAGRSVLEIGPGPGGLTRALFMEGADRVIAIERDERCRPALEQIAERYPGRFDVIWGDALAMDWRDVASRFGCKPIIAANLPYNVATLLLINWLETEPWPPWYERMSLMFQREVADRITSRPNSKSYGRLAVISQWRCEVSLSLALKPDAFVPPPKVSSALVEFVPRATMAPPCPVDVLGKITAAAFGQRRKMLRQSLKAVTAFPELLLDRCGIEGTRRGETLSVTEFATLAMALSEPAHKA
ncbi:MAG TPA: 16S rRNA (adenine(1518)-N(6)/adenine(1519)-N(6))-dimethyltransferase RsmA [Hyphomicrobiaceae bacterium]|nr:16S rRNA (adenine(1518)-N(6)/adenine(1519)-N(6))-dimethyltransferase RsmA [Hyphomicrobiaceae bacterium]